MTVRGTHAKNARMVVPNVCSGVHTVHISVLYTQILMLHRPEISLWRRNKFDAVQ